MNSEDVNKIEWSKIVMAIAVGIVFVLQQYHAMELEDVKDVLVPRNEYTKTTGEFVPKSELMFALKNIDARLEALEKK